MTIEKMLRYVVLGGVFALPFIPLLVTQSLFFPFITGKNFTFRIIVEIMVASWLALALIRPEYRPNRSWLLGAFAIFVLVIGVADVFGANAFKSIWSNFERMEGWVTLAHLFAYFTVLISTLRSEETWKNLWESTIFVSLFVGIYGVLQLAGFFVINQGGVRLDATFGNATYLAVYMLFHVFIAALLFAQQWGGQVADKTKTWTLIGVAGVLQVFAVLESFGNGMLAQATGKAWLALAVFSFMLWLYVWLRTRETRMLTLGALGALMLLQVVILLFTATRGAILGLVGGIFLSALLLVLFAHQSRNAWRAATAVVVGVLVLSGGFFLAKDTQLVRSVPPLARLASISFTESTTVARFYNWGMAWEGVKEKPLLGWGQENYNLVFNKNYDPRMYAQEQWFDRVHNVVFDWLIAGGIIGFAAYISLFIIALFYLWGSGAFLIYERAILTGLLSGYGFHNLFVFDNIVSYLLFFSVLGYIASRVIRSKNIAPLFSKEFVSTRMMPAVALVAVVLVWGVAWGVNAKALAANRALLQAVSPQETLQKNLEFFEKSISYDSLGTQEAREHLVQGASRLAQNENVTNDVKQLFFDTAASELVLQVEAAPEDARFPLFLGTLHDAYGLYAQGKPNLERALELSPNKHSILFQLGLNAHNREAFDESLEYFKRAHELSPEYKEAREFYASELIYVGRIAEGREILKPLVESAQTSSQRVIQAYIAQGRYDLIAELWQARIARRPEDVQAYFALSATYYTAGNVSAAIKVLETLKTAVPGSATQAEQLIGQIRGGTAKVE